MNFKIITLGAGLALAATAALAGDKPAGKPGDRVEERVVVMVSGDGPGGMDADKDGSVSRAEFNAMHDRMWAKLDRNGDGKLGKDEMGDHGPGGHGPGHPGHGGHGPGDHDVMIWQDGGEGGPGRREVRVVRHGGPDGEGGLDANKDGRISLDEMTAPLRDHFREADKNRDGFLDKDEMGGDGDGRVIIRREERREEHSGH